jgi:hypothetical protein
MPRKGTFALQVVGAAVPQCDMAHAPNFKLALTPAIEPSGGPGAELATLEDAAHFVGLLRSWR